MTKSRNKNLKLRYGITLEDYERMAEIQGRKCAICGLPESENRNGVLYVDHCHIMGEIRGLLCDKCNTGLGRFNDSLNLLIAAIYYLQNRDPQIVAILREKRVS